jgi:hypothetical protein
VGGLLESPEKKMLRSNSVGGLLESPEKKMLRSNSVGGLSEGKNGAPQGFPPFFPSDTPNTIVGRHFLFWRDRLRQGAASRQSGLLRSIEDASRQSEGLSRSILILPMGLF